MAGRFKLLTDEHWSVQRQRITPGRLLRFLEDLAAEEAPFAGVIRFVPPE